MTAPIRARVVEVRADLGEGSSPRWRYGSGMVIGGRTVLTAAHVLVAAVKVEVLRHEKRPFAAHIDPAFVGDPDRLDLALLEIPELPDGMPFLHVAAVDRDIHTGEFVERCWAVGYPEFAEEPRRDGPSKRELAQVRGHIPPLSNLVGGLLSFEVTSRRHDLPPASRPLSDSEWRGMSGAAVIADEHLIGVVAEHAQRQGPNHITVMPLTALDDLDRAPAEPGSWWRRMGVADPRALRRLPGRATDGPQVEIVLDPAHGTLQVLDASDDARTRYLRAERKVLTERFDERTPDVEKRRVDDYVRELERNWEPHLRAVAVALDVARVAATCRNTGERYLHDVQISVRSPFAYLLTRATSETAVIPRPLPLISQSHDMTPGSGPPELLADWREELIGGAMRLSYGPISLPPLEEVKLPDLHAVPMLPEGDVEITWTATSSSTDGRRSGACSLPASDSPLQLSPDYAYLEWAGYFDGLPAIAVRGRIRATIAAGAVGVAGFYGLVYAELVGLVTLVPIVAAPAALLGAGHFGWKGTIVLLRSIALLCVVLTLALVIVQPDLVIALVLLAGAAVWCPPDDDVAVWASNRGSAGRDTATLVVPLKSSRRDLFTLAIRVLTPLSLAAIAAVGIASDHIASGLVIATLALASAWPALREIWNLSTCRIAISADEFVVEHWALPGRVARFDRDSFELSPFATHDVDSLRNLARGTSATPLTIRLIADDHSDENLTLPVHRASAVLAHPLVAGPESSSAR